jgi:signal transduction histidine kinase
MKANSLRLRLLAMATASVLLTVSLAGIGLIALFSNHVERSLRADLDAQVNRLVALIDPAGSPPAPVQDMPDPRFALPLGDLYWQVRDPQTGETARSPSLLDTTLAYTGPLGADGASVDAELPDLSGNDALASVRMLDFELDGSPPRRLEVIVAETTKALDVANEGFRNELIPALLVFAAIMVALAWVQVTLGLSPLSLIQAGITAIRTGRLKTLEGKFPTEVMPLVAEVNALIGAQETSIAFARARAADLAHGIKTGLTVLNGEAAALRAAGGEAAASRIEDVCAEMASTIDHQLRLTRLRRRPRSTFYATPLASEATKIAAILERTPSGSALLWDVDVGEHLTVNIDVPDLRELLGIVIENATKWASTRVRISAEPGGAITTILIEDDGAGLDDAGLVQLGQRGRRLDQTKPGSGIGLSIALEIVQLNDGAMDFERSSLGGLQVTIRLPATAASGVVATA